MRSNHNGDLLDQVRKKKTVPRWESYEYDVMNKKETRTKRNSNKNASVAVDLTQIINKNSKKRIERNSNCIR